MQLYTVYLGHIVSASKPDNAVGFAAFTRATLRYSASAATLTYMVAELPETPAPPAAVCA